MKKVAPGTGVVPATGAGVDGVGLGSGIVGGAVAVDVVSGTAVGEGVTIEMPVVDGAGARVSAGAGDPSSKICHV